MSNGLHLLKKLGAIGAQAQQVPSGRWVLVGTVPATAMYQRKDGSPMTPADIEMVCQYGSSPRCARRTYATQGEALAAALEAN